MRTTLCAHGAHEQCPGFGRVGVSDVPLLGGRPRQRGWPPLKLVERPDGFTCACSCHRAGPAGVREPRRPFPPARTLSLHRH
jgi:hypothetical protein